MSEELKIRGNDGDGCKETGLGHDPGCNEKDVDETEMQPLTVKSMLKEMPLTEDTSCGYWIFRGPFLQRFANQTAYVFLYGLVGCIFNMGNAYFSGTITTIEKRFKIPSRNSGIISIGCDISQLFASTVLSYLASKGHRPRWMGFGVMTHVVFCLMTSIPHFLYGPGEDAIRLTKEYVHNTTAGVQKMSELVCRDNAEVLAIKHAATLIMPSLSLPENSAVKIYVNSHASIEALESLLIKYHLVADCRKDLWVLDTSLSTCKPEAEEGNLEPQIILFIAQFISGIGGSLFFSLGATYMDDNTPKEKTPILLSFSYFMRMLGPALGYTLASYCLRIYVAPHLTPIITNDDPRWLGAWWLGWLVITVLLASATFLITMYPKELPQTAARRRVEMLKRKENETKEMDDTRTKASYQDMKDTFMRLMKNKIFMHNNFASVFYIFGYMPFWIYAPKYIEIQYRKSAATANFVTGTLALGFSAIGILSAGFVISRYKPKARQMAMWNFLVGIMTVSGMLAYSFIGCVANEKSVVVNIPQSGTLSLDTCNSACGCDYVPFTPVCGEDGFTYISPCHAGCKEEVKGHGVKVYRNCSCIKTANDTLLPALTSPPMLEGTATSGNCLIDCFKEFYIFLAIMCSLKLIGASARATNFLVAIRCVDEKDKVASIGIDLTMMSMFAFIPSPIFFGWLFDQMCLVWGKTCSSQGNCWLYDAEALRFYLNVIAATFGAIGAFFDLAVWYYVKDLQIFDVEVKEEEEKTVKLAQMSNEKLSEL